MARPKNTGSLYTPELVARICEGVAEGNSLRSVLRQDGMPSIGAFLRWVSERPELEELYTRARASCLDAMAEDIIDIADTPEIGIKTVSKATGMETTEADMVEHRRLRIESRKWLMARLAPRKYGDRLELAGGLTVKKSAADYSDAELAEIVAGRKPPTDGS